MRLDVTLVNQKQIKTRTLAQDYIKEGCILINGKVTKKPSYDVKEGDVIEVLERTYSFASRGGIKLYEAIQAFSVDLNDKVVLDVGASTGGFSDVCLQLGAKHVYALDVGHDQLAQHLKEDKRISNMEGINAKYLESSMFELLINFICMDVSFISIKQILESVCSVATRPFVCVLLIKPQFEVGKAHLNKQGIVKDKKVHKKLLKEYIDFFASLDLHVNDVCKSSVTGRGGNQEYLVYLKSEGSSKGIDIDKIVS